MNKYKYIYSLHTYELYTYIYPSKMGNIYIYSSKIWERVTLREDLPLSIKYMIIKT